MHGRCVCGGQSAMFHSCSQHAPQPILSLQKSPVEIIERVHEMTSLIFIFLNDNVNRMASCSLVA